LGDAINVYGGGRMKQDRDKTKDQLIDELEELRKRVEKLETSEAKLKVTEKELREREETRSAVFNATPDLIAVIDKQ